MDSLQVTLLWCNWPIFIAITIRKSSKNDEEKSKAAPWYTISGSPGNRVQICLWRHRIRGIQQIYDVTGNFKHDFRAIRWLYQDAANKRIFSSTFFELFLMAISIKVVNYPINIGHYPRFHAEEETFFRKNSKFSGYFSSKLFISRLNHCSIETGKDTGRWFYINQPYFTVLENRLARNPREISKLLLGTKIGEQVILHQFCFNWLSDAWTQTHFGNSQTLFWFLYKIYISQCVLKMKWKIFAEQYIETVPPLLAKSRWHELLDYKIFLRIFIVE